MTLRRPQTAPSPPRFPPHVLGVSMPPIVELSRRMAEKNAAGGDVISLGQSVPFFGPPPGMTDAVAKALTDFGPRLHTYGPDAGIPELRAALARKLADFNGVRIDPDSQIIVTPGSNQAFMVALMTILGEGDEVAIASPRYFNHHMAIELCGGTAREIHLSEENGFQMRMEDVERALTPRTRAVVVNSPNNPSGAVYDREETALIAREIAARGIYVICDDAYEAFCYDGAQHATAAALADDGDLIITLGSMSKTFGMTGWRIGYMAAGAEVVRHAIKVQDSMAICAPIVCQIAALAALEHLPAYPQSMIAELEERRRALESALARTPRLRLIKTHGALCAMVRDARPGESGGGGLAAEMLERADVLAVPGAAFGERWRDFIRLSFGSAPRDRYEEALDRIVRRFAEGDGARDVE